MPMTSRIFDLPPVSTTRDARTIRQLLQRDRDSACTAAEIADASQLDFETRMDSLEILEEFGAVESRWAETTLYYAFRAAVPVNR